MTGFERLKARLEGMEALEGETFNKITTLRVGGPARLLARPKNEAEVCRAVLSARAEGVPVLFVGNGSNMLVADEGYMGLTIHLGAAFYHIKIENGVLYAEAGALLSKMAALAAENGLSGLEFAAGIPGTAGGAALMNAGAYGHDISERVLFVRVLNRGGNIENIPAKDMRYGYRASRALEENLPVLGAALALTPGDKEDILARMRDYNDRRKEKQPLNYPSAGSFFKRPEGHFAGALIERAGLKGLSVGGAAVSTKHAGFLVNLGGATAEDFFILAEMVKREVKARFNVTLEPEVRYIGRE